MGFASALSQFHLLNVLIAALFLFFGFFMNRAAAALAGAAVGAGLTAIDLALALIARAGNVTATCWT